MKSIFIPVEDHDSMTAVMDTALLLAKRFNSYVEGAALGPDIAEMVAADFSLSGVIFDERTRRELLDHARLRFEGFMSERGVASGREPGESLTSGWIGDTLVSDNGIGEYGRVFDVIAVGRPGAGAHQPRKSTLEAALFESGRPILIAPPVATAKLGECVMIAWNGSSETARTVAFAMPLLTGAADVPVMTIPGSRLPGPTDTQLVEALRRHGIKARAIAARETSKPQGTAVLEQAAALGVDLLIKGGYTQSRLRQMIFGGPTSQILAEATIPVFMAH